MKESFAGQYAEMKEQRGEMPLQVEHTSVKALTLKHSKIQNF